MRIPQKTTAIHSQINRDATILQVISARNTRRNRHVIDAKGIRKKTAFTWVIEFADHNSQQEYSGVNMLAKMTLKGISPQYRRVKSEQEFRRMLHPGTRSLRTPWPKVAKDRTLRPQNIRNITDPKLGSVDLGLDYYERHIPAEQFRLLTDFLSYAVPGNSYPEEIFYPEDL